VPTLLFRAENDWLVASLAWTRSNCSRVMTAGTVPTSIHSRSGSGVAVPWGRPIGWVAERRIWASRHRARLA
jgi:hypothetical protein